MKTQVTQMIYGLSISLPLTFASVGHATKTSDLALQCHGKYQVISAKPYYKPIPDYPTRAPLIPYAGANEVVKIIELKGKDCSKLKTYYSIDLFVGKSIELSVGTSPATLQQSIIFANKEVGKTYPFKATQSFSYAEENGALPLFPYVHNEWVQILNLTGHADSKALYGTTAVAELNDDIKAKLAKYTFEKKEWGKVYQSSYGGSISADYWINLLSDLSFDNEALALEHIENLTLFFKNASKFSGFIYPDSSISKIAQSLSENLNKYGKSKWHTKLEVLKANPVLMDPQIIQWAENGQVLKLTAAEIEDFLSHALKQISLLEQIPLVNEAQYLSEQYKKSAQGFLTKSIHGDIFFELTPKSLELIETIKTL